MDKGRPKVLIISLQGMGNVILALPAIKQYSEINSSDITMFVANHGLHKVLSRMEFIKDIYLWDGNKPFYVNIFNLRNKLKNYAFDEAFTADPNLRRENLLLFLSRAKAK